MINKQSIIISGESLLRLLTAYFDGDVPLDAKLINVGTSQFLQRWVGLTVESAQWPTTNSVDNNVEGDYPLQLRYEGKRNLSWSKRDGEPEWGNEGVDFEVPK